MKRLIVKKGNKWKWKYKLTVDEIIGIMVILSTVGYMIFQVLRWKLNWNI